MEDARVYIYMSYGYFHSRRNSLAPSLSLSLSPSTFARYVLKSIMENIRSKKGARGPRNDARDNIYIKRRYLYARANCRSTLMATILLRAIVAAFYYPTQQQQQQQHISFEGLGFSQDRPG